MRRLSLPVLLLLGAACSSSPPTGAPPPPPPGPPPAIGRTLFDRMPVGTGGGSLVYTKAGDALSGLTLTVPPGAYAVAVQWTIVADSSIAVPLPVGFSQVGPVLVVTNGQDYADSLITLTVPMHVAEGTALAPFYFDPASGTFEGIPLVGRTATSATLATRHFSRDFLAIPGSGATLSTRRQSLRGGFGSVEIVWVAAPPSQLIGTFATSFTPGVDDWEFVNYGDYISPLGDCEGMSITAIFYHYFFRLGASPRPGLFHQFDQSLANQWDNVQGIRFAGSVQGDAGNAVTAWSTQDGALTLAAVAHGAHLEDLIPSWILLTIKLTGHPVLMSLFGPGVGHAVVAYAASSDGTTTTVSFADPNYPGNTTRAMVFNSGVLAPLPLSINATANPKIFNEAYALGVTGEIALSQLNLRWQEFVAKTAGADRYPGHYHLEIFDSLNNSWSNLGSTFQTTDSTVHVRFICPDCPAKLSGGEPDQQAVQLWDGTGHQDLGAFSGELQHIRTTTPFVAVARGVSPFEPGIEGFVDSAPFTFIHGTFFILSSTPTPSVGANVDFVTHHGTTAVPGSTFTWLFGDGTLAVVKTDDSAASHAYQAGGSYIARVDMRDPAGALIGHATIMENVEAPLSIKPAPLNANPGLVTTLSAMASGVPATGVTYSWDFGDHSPPLVVTDNTTVQHTWTTVNSYPVTLNVDYVVAGAP